MRGRKVDQAIMDRIVVLHTQYDLKTSVIAIRLGLSPRTVRVYLRAWRTKTVPYLPDVQAPAQTG